MKKSQSVVDLGIVVDVSRGREGVASETRCGGFYVEGVVLCIEYKTSKILCDDQGGALVGINKEEGKKEGCEGMTQKNKKGGKTGKYERRELEDARRKKMTEMVVRCRSAEVQERDTKRRRDEVEGRTDVTTGLLKLLVWTDGARVNTGDNKARDRKKRKNQKILRAARNRRKKKRKNRIGEYHGVDPLVKVDLRGPLLLKRSVPLLREGRCN